MAEYFRGILGGTERSKEISMCVKTLRQYKPEAIAVRGFSGACFGSIVAYKMQLPLILVRKPGDSSHTSESISYGAGAHSTSSYVIVDDFVCSGTTVWNVADRLGPVRCMGVYLYKRPASFGDADMLHSYKLKYIPHASHAVKFQAEWEEYLDKQQRAERSAKLALEKDIRSLCDRVTADLFVDRPIGDRT